jgi:SAM-dependent methyltransferase
MSPRGIPPRPPPAPALAHTLGGQLRRLLGLRQTITVDGVRYRERTAEPLRHALSRKGPGYKEYDVSFGEGPAMRIRATAERQFADLTGARLLPVYQRATKWLTPGLRVAVLQGGTGYGAAWIAERVGPSGAVVSIDRDEESAAFARRRYTLPNVAFDAGGVESLSGETDGSFDAVLAVSALGQGSDPAKVLSELWRVVGMPGWLFAAEPVPAEREAARARADALAAALRSVLHPPKEAPPEGPEEDEVMPRRHPQPEMATDIADGWITIVAHRPGEEDA